MTQQPYADAAWAYFSAGWRGVLPLPAGQKTPPPARFTGWAAGETTAEHIGLWTTGREAGGNIALHFGDAQLYGLDVDAYGSKDGAAALAELVERCGPLPATWISTSRDDGVSGIRLFRANLPEGRVWLDEPGGRERGIEAIHRGHRYAVVWPSIHPEGRKYLLLDPSGQPTEAIPSPSELPWLPAAWVEAISKPGEIRHGTMAGHDETLQIIDTWPTGKMCGPMALALGEAIDAMQRVTDGAALHPILTSSAFRLANLAHEGHTGGKEALASHYGPFLAARMASGRSAGEGGASAEWWRSVRGAVGKLTGLRSEIHLCEPPVLPIPAVPAGTVVPSVPGSAPEVFTPNPTTGGRRVDLSPFLDGSYVAPEPSAGAVREDGKNLLYPGKWHTLIAPNASGKSWWALWHCMHEMNAGNYVVYAHFEEADPGGTIARLRGMGMTVDVIRDRFVWLDCTSTWQKGEFAHYVEGQRYGPFGLRPTLIILDGINEACGRQGWPVNEPVGVTAYKDQFVLPATRHQAAVLSLGHPPKARDRKDERHGFGSTAWLDLADGVGFRLEPSKNKPIGKGKGGVARLYSVKDRYGSVERLAVVSEDDWEGWKFLGSFVVDDTAENVTRLRLTVPKAPAEGEKAPDAIDALGDLIVEALRAYGGRYEGVRDLENKLRAHGVKFDKNNVGPAVQRLVASDRLCPVPNSKGRQDGVLPPSGQQDDPPSENPS